MFKMMESMTGDLMENTVFYDRRRDGRDCVVIGLSWSRTGRGCKGSMFKLKKYMPGDMM